MTEREQVIANLLFMKKDCLEGSDNDKTIDRAVKLLKEQEPRVLTLKEIISAECVWIEYATSGNIVIALPWDIELTDDTYNFIGMPNCFVEFRSLYGEEWRCWSARPTEEQREKVKWE